MCKTTYHQLALDQRYQISLLHKRGIPQATIAQHVGVMQSTISRELRRNCGKRGYKPQQADAIAQKRKFASRSGSKKMTSSLINVIESKLKENWSPEQIEGRLKAAGGAWASHESIYKLIWSDKKARGTLYKHLRHSGKKYNKRSGSNKMRGVIPNRKSIEERPAQANEKTEFGHFEIDLMIGKGHSHALLTIVDRKTKFVLIKHLATKKASEPALAIIELLKPLRHHIFTITSDNGKEFALHEEVSKKLGISYYFANPYASYERGLNENTNGLIRQFFPKNRDFSTISKDEVQYVQNALNTRPRKTLNYQTPNEILFREIACA